VDITNLNAPHVDTCVMTADQAADISIDGDRAYLADYRAGLRILDVTDPSSPNELGGADSVYTFCETAVGSDSFAFASWPQPPLFRSFLVSDPTRPLLVGGFDPETDPVDMAIRDTFVYLVGRLRLNVVNVARPRQPVLVGSCVTGDATGASVCLQGTLAYLGNFVGDVVNVQDPTNPQVLGHFGRGGSISVRDTFAFMASGGTLVYSIADPSEPTLIDSFSVGSGTYCVEAVGSLLYTGHQDGLRVIDASDVHNMRVRGYASVPSGVGRLSYESPYLYASCGEAGVFVFESTQVAVVEERHIPPPGGELSIRPNPSRGAAVLVGLRRRQSAITVRDIAGRVVPGATASSRPNGESTLDLVGVTPGVYFVEVRAGETTARTKFVRQ
jgi:hypothetical protein